jgi:hypothetical protein
MSAIACPIALPNAVYPPIRKSAIDLSNEAKLQALKAQAPFGRAPSGDAVSAIQYSTAMNRQIASVKGIDFRWPFWVGLGLGSTALVVLLVRHRGG